MTARESPITGLTLGEYDKVLGPVDASKASELFMRPCLRLQHFRCIQVRFDRGPPFRLLRMLPFFASITTLQLWKCTFQNFRAMMDVVWACPNLTLLDIGIAEFNVQPSSATGLRQMTVAVENLRACQKLTSLFLPMWGPATAELRGVGRVFGCAVTELYVESYSSYMKETLGTMLRDSFPALRSVAAISTSPFLMDCFGLWDLPLLHVVTVGRPIPGRLKKIVVQNRHNEQNNRCCKWGVGTSEKVVGPEQRLPWLLSGWEELTIREQRLPELLSELVELTIRLDECGDPESAPGVFANRDSGLCDDTGPGYGERLGSPPSCGREQTTWDCTRYDQDARVLVDRAERWSA
ncbi:hypothetical protein VTO73DRAFT_12963 [Trametes versicolor]